MEQGKISERQLAFMFATVLLSTVVFFMPQLGARAVEQDVWLTAIIATLWGSIVVLLTTALANRFPGLTLIEYLPLILGKPLGKLTGFLYTFWFLFFSAVIVREFAVFLNITIMSNTPVLFFMSTIVALSFYAIRCGLEVWSRVNELLLPVVFLSMLAIIILPFEQMDFRRLLPIAEHSPGSLIATSIPSASWRGEIFMASMFIPALTSFRRTPRNLVLAVVLTGVILSAVEVAAISAFGGVTAGQMEFPFFSLVRMISLAKVFDRLEVLIVIAWLLGTFFKICVFMYCSTRATAQLMGFKEFQFLLLPIAVLTLALADNVFESVVEMTDFLTHVWPGYALLSFELVLPLALYLVALFRTGKNGGGSA